MSIPFSSNDIALLCFNSFQLAITCVGILFSSNDVALLCFNSCQLGSTLWAFRFHQTTSWAYQHLVVLLLLSTTTLYWLQNFQIVNCKLQNTKYRTSKLQNANWFVKVRSWHVWSWTVSICLYLLFLNFMIVSWIVSGLILICELHHEHLYINLLNREHLYLNYCICIINLLNRNN